MNEQYKFNVSYVGNIIGEYKNNSEKINSLKDATKGYLDGLSAIQSGHYEDFFIKGNFPQYVNEDLISSCPLPGNYQNTNLYDAYMSYLILPQITFDDRLKILQSISVVSAIDLFDTDCSISNLSNSTDHYGEKIPYEEIVSSSKINLIIPERTNSPILSESVITCMLLGGFAIFPYSEIYYKYYSQDEIVCFKNFFEARDLVSHYLSNLDELEEKRLAAQIRTKKLLEDFNSY